MTGASPNVKFIDLTQDFSLHPPAFAGYAGPAIRWIKRLAFDKAGGQEITMTMHVTTHLDAPAHFLSGGKFVGDLPLDFLIGPACVVDLERMGLGDYDLYGPEHFERWEKDTGLRIERGDILAIHTGYHRHYPENWADRSQVDETKYFIRHPGPTRAFAEWVLKRGVRWIAIDAGSADHPMNTVIRRIRADEAEEADKKLGRSLDEIFPKAECQIMHINRIPNLNRIYEQDGGVVVQALARQAEVEDSKQVGQRCPLLGLAVRLVAHRVIRNRGTVCGSLAHADPASELPATLLVLNGHVVARPTRGTRIIPAVDFFTSVFETTLAPDELVVEAWFPASTGKYAIAEESRRHGDFALAGGGRDGARLAPFRVDPTPPLAGANGPTRGPPPRGELQAASHVWAS